MIVRCGACPKLPALAGLMLTSITLTGAVAAPGPAAPAEEPAFRRVALAPRYEGLVKSVAWSPGGDELLFADYRGHRLLRYGLDGKPRGEVGQLGGPTLELGSPEELRWVDGTLWLLARSLDFKEVLVRLDADLRPSDVLVLDDIPFGDGTVVHGLRGPAPYAGAIFAVATGRSGRTEDLYAVAALHQSPPAKLDVFVPYHLGDADAAMHGNYRDVVAEAAGHVYALAHTRRSHVEELWPRPRVLQAFPDGYRGLPPPPSGLMGEAAALTFLSNLAATPVAVGVYGGARHVYVLTRKPADGGGTLWLLHRIEPLADRLEGTLELPTRAADLLVAPGPAFWALVEKGPMKPGAVQSIASVVLVPSSLIEGTWPPKTGQVDPGSSATATVR